MAGKDPRGAVQAYVRPLQQALSCVTDKILTRPQDYSPGRIHVLTFATDDGLAPLASRTRIPGSRFLLSFSQHYRIIHVSDEPDRGPWNVSTAAYLYELDDADGHHVLAYHWHPEGRSHFSTPHMHLGHGARIGRTDLANAHLPTGRIAIQELLRAAITQLGVQPRREDWSVVLERTLRIAVR